MSIIGAALFPMLPELAFAQEEGKSQFDNVEIRVIRPKYFQKSMRVEIGANIGAMMNKTYTYVYLPAAKLGLHITEWLELFGEGAIGITINKTDCVELGSKFGIEPRVDEFKQIYGGGVSATPIYGKYQLSSGDVVYFDWFLMAGAGAANINLREQGCRTLDANETRIPPNPYTPMHFNIGTGQRFFLNKTTSLNWHLRDFFIANYEKNGFNQSVTLSFGASYYF
jgi:outer membrane beta-barrel protein